MVHLRKKVCDHINPPCFIATMRGSYNNNPGAAANSNYKSPSLQSLASPSLSPYGSIVTKYLPNSSSASK